MVLRVIGISLIVGMVIGILAFLFLKSNSLYDLDKINQIIENQSIEEDDFDSLNAELRRLNENGLIVSYLSTNFYIGVGLIMASIFAFFFGIHLLVDKLFFKKFFEKPSFKVAIRRGVLLIGCLSIMLYLKLLAIKGFEMLIAPLLAIIVEIAFTNAKPKTTIAVETIPANEDMVQASNIT